MSAEFMARLREEKMKDERAKIFKENYQKNHEKMKEIFAVLKANLGTYSEKYGEEIKQNKVVRAKFNEICNKIGIDPINSKKSMWGKFGDFYTQLSVQILRICEKQREFNGGLMKIEQLVKIFNLNYPKNPIDK